MSCCCGPSLDAALNADKIHAWNPIPNSATAPLADGINAPTATGTATARPVTAASTSILLSAVRLGYLSAAAINSVAGGHAGNNLVNNGAAVQPTGNIRLFRWKTMFTWGIPLVTNAESRMFVGMTSNVGAPTAVDPATLLNAIGFGNDSGETTMRFYARDGAANAQELNLGVNFPVNVANEIYRCVIGCRAGAIANPVTFDWAIERLMTGHRASGVVNTLAGPDIAVSMSPRLWRATGAAVATAVDIDLVHMRIVTDF